MSRKPSWDAWQTFQAVMATGSLSAAARQLGVSQATARGRIDALEASLDTVLFVRSAAGLSPTAQARAMVDSLDVMKRTSETLLRTASGASASVDGTVRVSASEFVGAVVLPSMLGRLRERHPGVTLELAPNNALIDLTAQEADLAVRMFLPKGDGLVARKVGTLRLGFYASRTYVARRGLPRTLEELLNHELIGPDQSALDWSLVSRFHSSLEHGSFILRTDNHVAQLMAIRAGNGIGVIQRPIAELDESLVPVLPERDFASFATFIVVHEDLRKVPKVRAVFDWLVEEFERHTR